MSASPHLLQRVLDNPWLLLAVGLALPIVSYTVWGLVELSAAPVAALP